VRRFAVFRIEGGTPGERVPKDGHVRRQLRPPRRFPLSPNLDRCCTRQRSRMPKVRWFNTPLLKLGHANPPGSAAIPKHPNELRLDCAKTQAGEERKLDRFWANAVANQAGLKPSPRHIRHRCQSSSASRFTAGDTGSCF
jgi:hypothetical protein